MSLKLKHEIQEWNILLRSIPASVVAVFAISVVAMNLLANKSIALPVNWLALDGGILVSWISFLSMDVITKHFGPKAATEISVFAAAANFAACLIFFIAGKIPGMWGEGYGSGSEALINGALDRTFSGAWYVVLGSTVAFIASALINNFLNHSIGKSLRKKNGFGVYVVRTYVSTAVSQLCDNLIFAWMVGHFFFGWTPLQCVMCSVTGMAAELLCEAVFSPVGYAIGKKWEREQVGQEYFAFRRNKKDEI